MNSELNKRLDEARQNIYRLNKIDSILKELKNDESELHHKANEFKIILDKENLDVEKLNNKNIVSIFYSVTGKLDEKLEKEQREALSAKLKYDQANYDLESIRAEISELTKEKENYTGSIEEYNKLFKEKKKLLMSHSISADKISELTKKIEESRLNIKELQEAVLAGDSVTESLEAAMKSLSSAKGWGTWDLLGGGLFSDLAKHSHIDDAMVEVESAHYRLRRFKSELADVKINNDIKFETGGFGKFADFFFDGLIADWFMQTKINNSYESVSNVKNQVESTIYTLRQLENREKLNLKELENELNKIILGS